MMLEEYFGVVTEKGSELDEMCITVDDESEDSSKDGVAAKFVNLVKKAYALNVVRKRNKQLNKR